MGNVLTVEAASPIVLAAAIIAITVALQCSKREASRPSQGSVAREHASMTNNQLTYSGLNHPVIYTANYYGSTVPQLPFDTRGTTSRSLSNAADLILPPQVQVSNVASEATLPRNFTVEKTSQLPLACSEPQSPPVNLMNANDESQLIRVGVWGNPNVGNSFKHKGFDGIKTIKICSSSSVIYSIEVEYIKDGELKKVEKAGGKDGCPQESECDQQEIVLETGEYINKASGYYGPYLDDKKVRSLAFTTNMDRVFGPYGEKVNEDEENTTSFYVEGGRVMGFYGNAKSYISAIGFYVLPLNAREGSDLLVKVGLWGKKTTHSFKHLGYEGIETLRISHSAVIDCIKVKYRNNDEVHSQGGLGGNGNSKQIVFEDGEYINKVIGYYGRFKEDKASPNVETINRLVFTTNKQSEFACGTKIETWDGVTQTTPFIVKGGRIVGFHGTGGKYISSIGFYVLPPQVQEGRQILTPTPSVVKGVYWFNYNTGISAENINAALYTHIFCAFADIDQHTNKVTISDCISSFTSTFQGSNPSISTILSIGGGSRYYSTMASNPGSRESFITSAIQQARNNNFFGLDISWQYPEGVVDMENYGKLLTELRSAVNSEAISSGRVPLLLTAVLYYSARRGDDAFPIETIKTNLNWINLMNHDYHGPSWEQGFTSAPAALYDPKSQFNTNTGINCWREMGLPPDKIVLGLPTYGRAWKLKNSNINEPGAGEPANGPAVGDHIEPNGAIGYRYIKKFIERNNAKKFFDSSVVSNYCYSGTTWIGYDDVESVREKVVFAKNRGLLGYNICSVGNDDDDFVLSRTACNAH